MTINSIHRTYKDFFTECPQLFALFNACDSSKGAAERALNRLSQGCRNKVFKKVYTAAGKPATTEAQQWGEHNALEDLPCLQNALQRIARKIFGSLDISQQRRAEDLAYEHAGRLATDDPEWGRGNVLLHSLADTQVLECVELWAKEVRAQRPWLDDSLAAVSTEIRRFLADPSATRLNLSELHLPSLPPVFDLEPFTTRLQRLDCSNNWLTALPSEIGNCTALRELYCSNNRLTELPREIGNCTALRRLNCSYNELAALPAELLRLPQGCRVDLTGCPLSATVRRRLREATQQPNYQGPRIHFSMGGGVQRAARSISESLKELCEWAEEEPVREFPALLGVNDASLELWLSRLGDVHDCGRQELRRECARKILEYLQLAQDNPSFRETFFIVINGAADTCGDRMAFFLLNLGVQHRLATADLRDGKKLAHLLIRGVWCLNQLQKIACDKVKTMPFVDEIEVYLIYPIRLREALDLPIDIRDMHFADLAGVSKEELTEAGLSVLARLQNEEDALCGFLITQPKWLEAMKLRYPEEYATCCDKGDVDGMKALTRSFLQEGASLSHP
jgi:hypothetical protein